MEQIGAEFTVLAGNAGEVYKSSEPEEIVKELALLKAEAAEKRLAPENSNVDSVILGADTIVVNEGRILGKPADEEEAFLMLSSLSGKWHQVYTGTAFICTGLVGERSVITHAERTDVFVRELSGEELWGYIHTKDPFDKAGGYGIQGPFAAFIPRIEGDYYNVVGLPVAYVYGVLKELGELE